MHTAQLNRLATVRNYALGASCVLWAATLPAAGRVSRDLLIVALGLTVCVTVACVNAAIAHFHARFMASVTELRQAERDKIYVEVVHGLVTGGTIHLANGAVPTIGARRSN